MRIVVPERATGRLGAAWRACVGTGRFDLALRRLYEVTAHAVKEVDAALQVGGPALSPGADDWLPRFADFVAARSVPVDFVSKHAYSSGPARHLPFGVHQTLTPAAELLKQFATPAALLRDTALAGLPVPTTLFHGGFGLLTHRQIKKPTYHLYAFLARLGDEVLARGPDYLVTRDGTGRITVLAWAPVDVTGREPVPDRHTVRLSLPLAAPGASTAFLLRSSVSEEAGNAWRAWCEMGRPASPRTRQLDALREAAEPVRRHASLPVVAGRVALDLDLSRHEVTLVELTAVADETPPWWSDERLLGQPAGEEPA
ncbi:hypothetical protein [Micromonospora sp. HK10]|uniref:GH39 family glycosyl hydrolase n=1 Tax=Micromonospora sp. HK10 TaxID=1538294 RepID=UPI000698A357|nr:hypothetical protein [Micromonospora sp. HK10]